MKPIIKSLLVLFFFITALDCTAQKRGTFKPKVVYKSKDLIVTQITKILLNTRPLSKPTILGMFPVMASS